MSGGTNPFKFNVGGKEIDLSKYDLNNDTKLDSNENTDAFKQAVRDAGGSPDGPNPNPTPNPNDPTPNPRTGVPGSKNTGGPGTPGDQKPTVDGITRDTEANNEVQDKKNWQTQEAVQNFAEQTTNETVLALAKSQQQFAKSLIA